MITILKGTSVEVHWRIIRTDNKITEDFTGAELRVFLVGPDNVYPLACDVAKVDGYNEIHLAVNSAVLSTGVYDLKAVWVKNKHSIPDVVNNQFMSVSRRGGVLAVTNDPSEVTPLPLDNTIKLMSYVESYGRDGMSAYELAAFRGVLPEGMSEAEWAGQENVRQQNEEQRKVTEAARREAEATREVNERLREQGEAGRVSAEVAREEAEGVREATFQTNEAAREAEFDEAIQAAKDNLVVVNDLTTGGADKALSAEMGKELLKSQGMIIKDNYLNVLTPNFSSKADAEYAVGTFNAWWGFSTIQDLDTDTRAIALVFSEASEIEVTWKFRLSQKVRDTNGNITGLTVIPNSEISLKQSAGSKIIYLPQLEFKKDYVWELYFGYIDIKQNCRYVKNSSNPPYVKFINGAKHVNSSMYYIDLLVVAEPMFSVNARDINAIKEAITIKSKNLFSPDNVIDGFVDITDGVIRQNKNVYPKAKCSKKIKVTSGKYYTISGRTDTKGIVGYDVEGNLVQIISGSWQLPNYNGTFLVPNNVVEIQFSCVLYAEYTEDVHIQLEEGEFATDYENPLLIPYIGQKFSKIERDTEILKYKQALDDNLLYESIITPDFVGLQPTEGSFPNWWGFSTEEDLPSDGILKNIIFSGTSPTDYVFKARVSKKVRDTSGKIIGLSTISDVFVLTLPANEHKVPLTFDFKKDYVLEIRYGSVPKGLCQYTSSAATGDKWVRYNDQVATVGSMWDTSIEVRVPKLAETQEVSARKSIKILSIGNSFAEDAFTYVPFILRDSCPDIDLTFGILYYGGCSLEQHYNHFVNSTAAYAYRKITPKDNKWLTPSTSASIQEALADDEWDIIVLQQNGSNAGNYATFQPYLNNLMKGIQSLVKKTVRFGWHMVEAYDSNLEASISRFNTYCETAKRVVDDTLVDIVFPSATGLQNARTTSLQSLGDAGNLMHSSNHAQEGIPCYCLALPNVLVIADLCGYGYKGICGDSNIPTQSWITERAIPNQNGSSVGATDENCKLAQLAGIFAHKKPYEITNLKALGYE